MNRITAFFLLTLLCVSCSDYGKIPEEKATVRQTITDLYMFESQSGQARWVLESKKADIVKNNEQAELMMPVITFKEKEKVVSKLQSEKGFLDLTTKNIIFTGSVEVQSFKEDIYLTTEKLNYSFDENVFFTDEYIKIKQKSAVIEGKGLRAYPDLSEIVIHNQKTKLLQK